MSLLKFMVLVGIIIMLIPCIYFLYRGCLPFQSIHVFRHYHCPFIHVHYHFSRLSNASVYPYALPFARLNGSVRPPIHGINAVSVQYAIAVSGTGYVSISSLVYCPFYLLALDCIFHYLWATTGCHHAMIDPPVILPWGIMSVSFRCLVSISVCHRVGVLSFGQVVRPLSRHWPLCVVVSVFHGWWSFLSVGRVVNGLVWFLGVRPCRLSWVPGIPLSVGID